MIVNEMIEFQKKSQPMAPGGTCAEQRKPFESFLKPFVPVFLTASIDLNVPPGPPLNFVPIQGRESNVHVKNIAGPSQTNAAYGFKRRDLSVRIIFFFQWKNGNGWPCLKLGDGGAYG
jgi:hypothetical protein